LCAVPVFGFNTETSNSTGASLGGKQERSLQAWYLSWPCTLYVPGLAVRAALTLAVMVNSPE